MVFLVGADPEVFVEKDGELASAYGLIPGTKDKPFPVNNGAVQVDGMALEFNINPASSRLAFAGNIASVKKKLKEMVPTYKIKIVSSVHFPESLMNTQPEEAKTLGCDPDYNAWTEELNETPNAATNMRTAAGHIHVGWTKDQDCTSPLHFSPDRDWET